MTTRPTTRPTTGLLVRVPPEVAAAVRREARAEDRPVNTWLRRAITTALGLGPDAQPETSSERVA